MALNNRNNDSACKCTTPKYTLVLNSQGPQGKTGPQGPSGFSPQVTVDNQTDTEYTLKIITSEGTITTPNLQGRGVPSNGQAGQYLVSNGNNTSTWQNIPMASDATPGLIAIADEDDITNSATDVAVNPEQLNNAIEPINTKLDDVVTLSTDQTVRGIKAFYSPTFAPASGKSYSALFFNEPVLISSGIELGDGLISNATINDVKPYILEYFNGSNEIYLGEHSQFPTTGNGIGNAALHIVPDNYNKQRGLYYTTTIDGARQEFRILDNSLITAGDNISITKNAFTGAITISSTGGGISEIPQATETTLGGIKASPKTEAQTQEVMIDTATGKLYVEPGGGTPTVIDGGNSSSTEIVFALPNAQASISPNGDSGGYIGSDDIIIE